jgi:hypothetical protein
LSEPLTIDIFFSRNLPAPYNNVEQYLRDLPEEYAVHANRFFNYRFYDVSAEEGDIPAEARRIKARQHLRHPPDPGAGDRKDEVKFQRAYMGMVLIHGDLIEQILTTTTTDGLEYRITTAIQKMNNKISAPLRLPDKIQVKCSCRLAELDRTLHGPEAAAGVAGRGRKRSRRFNAKTYGKLEY